MHALLRRVVLRRRCGLLIGYSTLMLIGCASPPDRAPITALDEIKSPTGSYSVVPMLGGWSMAATNGDASFEGDLLLLHDEQGVAATFYVEQGSARSLDDYVLRRRGKIDQHAEIVTFEELRRFQVASSFTPVSISTYRVRYDPDDGWTPIISGVIRGPATTVEIFATGGQFPRNTQLVEDLIAGVRFSR